MWELTPALRDTIYRYASFRPTAVSLRQMVQFGAQPNPGLVFLAARFVVQELPIRLAIKVKDLENAPMGLSSMMSVNKVKNWYAQSFQELTDMPQPIISLALEERLWAHLQQWVPADAPSRLHSGPRSDPPHNDAALNNVFSDDGIVLKHHHKPSEDTPGSHAALTQGFSAHSYTTYPHTHRILTGKLYYTPCGIGPWPQEILDYNRKVFDALSHIKNRHDATVATMAQGVKEWKASHEKVFVNSQIQTFLDKFYMLRIGIRMLIGQQLALTQLQKQGPQTRLARLVNGNLGQDQSGPGPEYVGIICTRCDVASIAADAIETAKFVCEEHYGLMDAPPIQLIAPDSAVQFMYVPGHLIHMLFETLKNSLRATIEHHSVRLKQAQVDAGNAPSVDKVDLNDLQFPTIKVIVSEGQEDIAIKVSDEGGGIPRSEIPLVWTYLYTTVLETPVLEQDVGLFRAPMAGFGYGLPISRLYAQYFGGDLKLISMEGYGTDVYLHLNRLSSSSEPLP